VNALANPEVGDYLNRHFIASFQKVGTFRIVGNQKQGGNVASYFCTPSGNVLDAIAGPVDAATLLREAKWVVETRKMALLEAHGDLVRGKQFFRRAHAEQLPAGARPAGVNGTRLPLPVPSEAALAAVLDNNPIARKLDKQGRIHFLLALYPLAPLDRVYKAVYEKILNEKTSTRPVAEGNNPPPDTTPPARGMAGRAGWNPLPATSPVAPVDPVMVSARDYLREQRRIRELRHARNDPPATEVYGAGPLNVLLADLRKMQDQGMPLAPVPLEAEVLAHVNVAMEADPNAPTAGLLKAGGKLRWPAAWREAPLGQRSADLRASLESALPEAVAQAKKGPVDPDLLTTLHDGVKRLDELLTERVKQVPSSTFTQASRYLNELRAALQVLDRDDAGRYLDGTLTFDPARIKTVPDLVSAMKTKAVKFAAAVEGDESAYLLLHRALAQCDAAGSPAEPEPEPVADRGDL
jgi:hypothetical protein